MSNTGKIHYFTVDVTVSQSNPFHLMPVGERVSLSGGLVYTIVNTQCSQSILKHIFFANNIPFKWIIGRCWLTSGSRNKEQYKDE